MKPKLISHSSRGRCSGWVNILHFVHEGDVIVMNNMARLARNRDKLRRLVECLVKRASASSSSRSASHF